MDKTTKEAIARAKLRDKIKHLKSIDLIRFKSKIKRLEQGRIPVEGEYSLPKAMLINVVQKQINEKTRYSG